MSRSVEEWIGRNDDTAIPARVKLRVFDKTSGRCAKCARSIVGRLLARFDHIRALINGGQNRESNLQLLCNECHDGKTRTDVREKSLLYRKRSKRLGLKNKKLMPGSKGSGFRKKMDGTVIREKP